MADRYMRCVFNSHILNDSFILNTSNDWTWMKCESGVSASCQKVKKTYTWKTSKRMMGGREEWNGWVKSNESKRSRRGKKDGEGSVTEENLIMIKIADEEQGEGMDGTGLEWRRKGKKK